MTRPLKISHRFLEGDVFYSPDRLVCLDMQKKGENVCYVGNSKDDILAWYRQGGMYGLHVEEWASTQIRQQVSEGILTDHQRFKNYQLWLEHPTPLDASLSLSYRVFQDIDIIIKIMQQYFIQHWRWTVDIETALHELLINSVEHGLCAMDAKTKHVLLQNDSFYEEILYRLHRPDLIQASIDVHIHHQHAHEMIIMTLQPVGFQSISEEFLLINDHPSHDEITKPTGRGLWIAQSLAFDHIYMDPKTQIITATLLTQSRK